MGKKERKKASTSCSGYLRGTVEEGSGKGSHDASSLLKVKHLQKLAGWAGGEGSIPPLAAFFGHRLAATGEALGIPPLDPSLISCERCETILQAGYNCTIRIQKNARKDRRKKTQIPTQNNVVYTCHFCSHPNLKRGTPKGYLKAIITVRPEPNSESKSGSSLEFKSGSIPELTSWSVQKPATMETNSIEKSPATPVEKTGLDAWEKKSMERSAQLSCENSVGAVGVLAAMEKGESSGRSRKRRKKNWSSLKEIAGENGGALRDLGNRTSRINNSLFFD